MSAPVFRLTSPPDADPDVYLAKGLFRTREAADWLGVSERQAREWIRSGRLRSVRPPSGEDIRAVTYEELVRFRAEWGER